MKIKNAIPISELNVTSNEDAEQTRARKHFENIKARGVQGKLLTEHEKNFFCTCLHFSLANDGTPEDYAFCEDYTFKLTYLTYMFDITGGNTYYKGSLAKIRELAKGHATPPKFQLEAVMVKVTPAEAQSDLDKLYDIANTWEATIATVNHTDLILQTISVETREQLKELDSAILNDTTRGAFYYRRRRQHTLLQSKYAYLVTKEVLETMKDADMILKLNGQEIEFNAFSLFHIIIRHYSPGTKQFITGKSFINKDFAPRQLHLQLSEIFSKIEASGAYTGNSLQKISFCYKGVPYRVWTKTATKQVAGLGNVQYMRVQSFYPIEEADDLSDLVNNYKVVKVDDLIEAYVNK